MFNFLYAWLFIAITCLLCTTHLQAQTPTPTQEDNIIRWTSSRPDGHAPMSLMGDHYHKKGELMFGYKYMPMWMSGNQIGTQKLNNDAVFARGYMSAPGDMRMDMHMLDIMYAPSDHVTLMVMGMYLYNIMDERMRMGNIPEHTMVMGTQGFSDVSVTALVRILNRARQSIHANVGISIPVGSISKKMKSMGMNMTVGYPMQLGSGTWDPLIGVTYLGQAKHISWGAQIATRTRIGLNHRDYRFGETVNASGWFAIPLSAWWSLSAALHYTQISTVIGTDKTMMPRMSPLSDVRNTGRRQLDAGVGVNFYIPNSALRGLRFGAEARYPLWQHTTGVQMPNGLQLALGVQYSWNTLKHKNK